MQRPRVGFIGLGFMGHGMADNILKRGFTLNVMAYRKRAAVDDLVSRGAVETTSPVEIAARSDVVLLCVTGAAEVDRLTRGETGLAAGAGAELIIVDCTTSNPDSLLKLAADYPQVRFADAPLGRSPNEAWQGKLSTMVGCEAEILEKIHPILSCFADTIQHVGELGDGHRLKLVNNLVSLGYAALYAEALVTARKAGLSTAAFDRLLRSSRMHCAFYDTFIGWALDGNADSHPFALDTALHTISDAVDMAQAFEVRCPVAESIRETYRLAVDAGIGASMLPELPRAIAAASGFDLAPERQ